VLSWKVGLHVELPCGPGSKILKSSFFEVRGGYCADVSYLRELGEPGRTTTVCDIDAPPLRRVQ